MQAIKLDAVTKLYRNGRGVRSINLEVAQGEVFGFLGPNGAGKTTLIRTLLGFMRPQAGTMSVFGLDAARQSREVRHRVGYLPSDPSLYDFLTGRQNIELSLKLRGINDRTRIASLADRLDIDLSRRLKTLSRGNKQKVAIAAALAHDPDLLVLDEPTSGLDPLVQETFAALIREEKARGKTVFMSSHVLSEVEALCDRVGIIRDGQIVAVDSVERLRNQRVKYVKIAFAGTAPNLAAVPGVKDLQADGKRLGFTMTGDLNELIHALNGQSVSDLTVTDPPLEEVFRAFYEGSERK